MLKEKKVVICDYSSKYLFLPSYWKSPILNMKEL